MKLKEKWINLKRKDAQKIDINLLTVADLRKAEREIYKHSQLESFSTEYRHLINNQEVRKTSPLLSLRPFISDGLIRVGGRIAKNHLPFKNKHQIVVAKDHPLSKLLIIHHHEMNCHCGREQTLGMLRETVWIINGKSLTRKVLKECRYCKRQTLEPLSPMMSDLPKQRLDIGSPAFNNTMIDYFGPLIVKLNKGTRTSQATTKRYGAIFSCLTTRATHIKLVDDLSTDKFILTLRWFICRSGSPSRINSDNGTNFVGAQRELGHALKMLNQKRIHNELIATKKPMDEAVIKLTKRRLKAITRDRLFKEEALSTYLTEVEAVLNNRSLTSISDDITDLEPLTPNHFLIGKGNPNFRFNTSNEADIDLRKQWKSVQAATSMLWKQWVQEYLPLLTQRQKWRKQIRNFERGDLVLISSKDIPRSNWPLARYSGHDVIRVVKVKTKDGVYTRPAAKLCLLEACN